MIESLRSRTLQYIDAQRLPGVQYGRYRYAPGNAVATLYSSCYAAMTRSLYHDLDTLTASEKAEWTGYLQSHQDGDGLFRDPAIFGEGWYAGDPLWCGRPHLTCHVIIALTCLGAVAERPLHWIEPFCDSAHLLHWLADRDWTERVSTTGNEIMNVGTLLQYARDFQQNTPAGESLTALFNWMEHNHLNHSTGLWGSLDSSDPRRRSDLVQAAYHFWTLWTFDERRIPHLERAVDSVLATQNPRGGFGWGVHNHDDPFSSSACEDFDSVEPLCRFMALTDYRREDVVSALTRGLAWTRSNQNDDGGFAFMRGRPFEYGHPLLRSERGVSGMFPTWFRTLTLAYIGRALPESSAGDHRCRFQRCPGYQF